MCFLLRINRAKIKKEVLAQSRVIYGLNEIFIFKERNLFDVSLKQNCFEFITIPRGFNF